MGIDLFSKIKEIKEFITVNMHASRETWRVPEPPYSCA